MAIFNGNNIYLENEVKNLSEDELLKKIKESKGEINYSELFNWTLKNVKKETILINNIKPIKITGMNINFFTFLLY